MSVEFVIKKNMQDFSLDVSMKSSAKRIGILGASGCGKSMTLKSIAGIVNPDEGNITIDGKIVFDSKRKINERTQKRNVGYMFQNYALFPNMTVEKNIFCGLSCGKEERIQKTKRIMQKFRLEGLEKRYPHEISGGEQQRVALARIMAYEPNIILLDEPFSAMDMFLKDQLFKELMKFLEDYTGTVLFVSHNRDEIYQFSEEILILNNGKNICQGKTKEIFKNPGKKEAAKLTGCKNISRIYKISDHEILAEDWNLKIYLKQKVTDDISYIGIRAHEFIPAWEMPKQNAILIREYEMTELPFEHKFFIRTDGEKEIYWYVQKERMKMIKEKGMPKYLKVPEEEILLLE